jgi:hypothetical protein
LVERQLYYESLFTSHPTYRQFGEGIVHDDKFIDFLKES